MTYEGAQAWAQVEMGLSGEKVKSTHQTTLVQLLRSCSNKPEHDWPTMKEIGPRQIVR